MLPSSTFLAKLGLGNCLEQGLSYAHRGHVLGMELIKNRITGKVQGTHVKPYHVEIRIKPFPNAIWDMVLTALAQQTILATAIINGKVPVEVENVFENAGVSLFPQSPKEFVAECSCPSSTNPCKHISAIFCILAQEFTKNPLIFFMLRGKSQDTLLTDLMEKRACIQQKSIELLPDAPLAVETLSPDELLETINYYWQTDDKLDDIHFKEETPPASCNVLQTLGNPPGWPTGQNFAKMMQPLYEHVKKANR